MSFALPRNLARSSWCGWRRLAAALTLGFLAMRAAAAEPEIEFSGVFGAASDLKLVLTAKATGQSALVAVGKVFAGYTVTAYEAKEETVVLTKDGQTLRLKMKEAKIKAGVIVPPPAVQKAILNNLRQLAAAADQFYLENGVATTTYDQLVGEKKYIKWITVQDGENYRALEFKQGKELVVTTVGGFVTRYAP